MHRSITALLVGGLALPGCLFGASSAVVHRKLSEGASDPFLTAQADSTGSQHVANTAVKSHSETGQSPPQLTEITTVDRNGVLGVDFEQTSTLPADKAEWWNLSVTGEPAHQETVEIPPSSSVQGRVGHASVSYGMGQISRP